MKKLFIIAAVALVGMASCSKENTTTPNNGGAEGVGTLAFFLNTDATPGTRANGTEAESKVNEVEIYIYNSTGTAIAKLSDGTTDAYLAIATPDFGEYTDTPDQSEFAPDFDGQYVTKVQVGAGTYQILVVANADLGAPGTATLMEMQAKIAAATEYAFSVSNTQTIPTNGFVMAGVNAAATVVAATSNTVEVDLYRNVAKITKPSEKTNGALVEITKNPNGSAITQAEFDKVFQQGVASNDPAYVKIEDVEWDTTNAGDTASDFDLTGYAVINGMIKSTVGFVGTGGLEDGTFDPLYVDAIPTYGNEWDAWDAGKFIGLNWTAQLSATAPINGATELALGRINSNSEALKDAETAIEDIAQWTGVYSGDGTIIKTNDNPVNIYLYESKPGMLQATATSYLGYNADQVIAVIIEGELTISYDNGEGLSGTKVETRYWRINVRANEAYHILRNSDYQTVINKISSLGWATPWEAEEETPIIDKPNDTVTDFVINVVPWNVLTVGPDQI
jgi:hypothetical protein